jgi:protoporphyrinogen oxidase
MSQKKAIIIGAGPAGLTAAYELLKRTNILPIVLEKSTYMGGISRTINYKGNRIDIGGHRFFSKSDRVMQWWHEILPIQNLENSISIKYQQKTRTLDATTGPNPESVDNVMLVRSRKSRIYFNRTFFDYPLKINSDTLKKMGLIQTIRIGTSYAKSVLFPIKKEENLEQFFINRFGKTLYKTFFKSYTEKVWGIPCNKISAEWGAQRIKGLSIAKTIKHFTKQIFTKKTSDISQKNIETSLIEQFLYPKFGPGQMWEVVAKKIIDMGGIIKTNILVDKIFHQNNKITEIAAYNYTTKMHEDFKADFVFSTMPVKDLMNAFQSNVPCEVKKVSDGLLYRDFITVGILAKKLNIQEKKKELLEDNWIYVQEPDVLVGRIQIFNNWSPYMVANPNTIWIGLEYFCYENDELWQKSDQELIRLAKTEIEKLGIINQENILDAVVIKMEKTYPAYFGTYDKFDVIKNFTDKFENLFLIGRNGMHKYNNQDHSMLTAMTAVDNIIQGTTNKSNIWSVNTEQEYHESK